MVRRVLGDGWARSPGERSVAVDPVRYASLHGHMPLIGLGREVVFGHVWWVG